MTRKFDLFGAAESATGVRDFVFLGAIALLILLLYRKVDRLFWVHDDAATVHQVIEYSAGAPFVNPAIWPQKLFTPLLNEAFELQYALWDVNAERWYGLHLVLAMLTAACVYFAIRRFFAPIVAFVATFIFVAGVPFTEVVIQLSTVHYLLAVAFAAIAVLLFEKWPVASAIAYLAAIFAKEIAVPLPLLLLALPIRDLRWRIRSVIPHGVALLAYFALRRAVLGQFFGDYGWVVERSDRIRLMLTAPWIVIRSTAGPNVIVDVLFFTLVLGAIVVLLRKPILLIALIVTLAPILPVLNDFHGRYAIAFSLALAIAFAAALHRIDNKRIALALMCAGAILAIVINRQEWGPEFRERQQRSDEARFFFDMPANGLLRNPATAAPTMNELNWIKTAYLKKPGGAFAFYDDYFLCTNDLTGKRVWQYDAKQRAEIEITGEMPQLARRHCNSIRMNAPLHITFSYDQRALHWDLGPYRDGKYSALLANGLQAGEVGAHAGLYMPGATGFSLRIRYQSPEGWTTYSPELALDLVHQPRMTYVR